MSNVANRDPALSVAAEHGGYAVWSSSGTSAEVRFAGRGPAGAAPSRAAVLAAIIGRALPVAWARQVHGARVLDATVDQLDSTGEACGEGDALIATEHGLALAIATADCVPVLLASPAAIGAAHAGWRGVVAGVVPNAVAALCRAGTAPAALTAWIGPSIGACCYEVGDDVARAVAAASSGSVVTIGPTGRPHVDLAAAVRLQLEALAVVAIQSITTCTRCDAARLWSYRRDGSGAGRNLAFVWRP